MCMYFKIVQIVADSICQPRAAKLLFIKTFFCHILLSLRCVSREQPTQSQLCVAGSAKVSHRYAPLDSDAKQRTERAENLELGDKKQKNADTLHTSVPVPRIFHSTLLPRQIANAKRNETNRKIRAKASK